MNEPKVCVDCVHYVWRNSQHVCTRKYSEIDLVTGERIGSVLGCEIQRSASPYVTVPDRCGPGGLYWKRNPHLPLYRAETP